MPCRLRRLSAFTPWLAGAAGGLAVVGPAFGAGVLFNLDLVVTSKMPVPRGIWGMGSLPPRDIPYWLPVAWASHLIGARAGAVFFVAAFTVAFVGAYRLAAGNPVICRLGAGALYAFSPFLLTRVAVGHTGVVAASAVLPWALPSLLGPAERPARTFIACLALACTGVAGAALTAPPLLVGLIGDRKCGVTRTAAMAALAQLPWLVPAAIVAGNGLQYVDSTPFATDASGLLGPLKLAAGHGFWRSASQIGGASSPGIAVVGGAILVLGLVGARHIRSVSPGRVAAAAGMGLLLAWASALPGLDAVYAAFSHTPAGLLVREGQRLLPVFLVWLAPAAASGAAKLAEGDHGPSRWAMTALPLGAAVALAVPGGWGLAGALRPVTLPHEWTSARSLITDQPGTVVALPFHEYLALDVARGRLSLNPLPTYLGGDVVSSSDPELGRPHREGVDPRELPVSQALVPARAGRPVADAFAKLGIRWVVVLHDVDWQAYTSLRTDPGLQWVVRGPTLDAFRVQAWRGPVVTATGAVLSPHTLAAPVSTLTASGAATWNHQGGWGWLRGLAEIHTAAGGVLALPAGGGLVWYWPVLLVAAADLLTVVLFFASLRNLVNNSPISANQPIVTPNRVN
jgi:hypothetical protein